MPVCGNSSSLCPWSFWRYRICISSRSLGDWGQCIFLFLPQLRNLDLLLGLTNINPFSGFACLRRNLSSGRVSRQAWPGWPWNRWMPSCCNACLLWANFVGRPYKRSSGMLSLFIKQEKFFLCLCCFKVDDWLWNTVVLRDLNVSNCDLNDESFVLCKAREFLYFKLYGKQCITPVAIMTSSAKNNHGHITCLCERFRWFGRGRSNFQIFEQVLIWCWRFSDVNTRHFFVGYNIL